MEVLGVLEILGKCPPTFESCPETDIISGNGWCISILKNHVYNVWHIQFEECWYHLVYEVWQNYLTCTYLFYAWLDRVK